jgi:hypothetical protein
VCEGESERSRLGDDGRGGSRGGCDGRGGGGGGGGGRGGGGGSWGGSGGSRGSRVANGQQRTLARVEPLPRGKGKGVHVREEARDIRKAAQEGLSVVGELRSSQSAAGDIQAVPACQ